MYPPQPPGQSPPIQAGHPHPAGAPVPGPATVPPPGPPVPPNRPKAKRTWKIGGFELVVDKFIDFLLIFVGLYAATAVQRWQDQRQQRQEYVTLLQDFKRELQANIEQEASIVRDLGPIENTDPGANLGPIQETFETFFTTLAKDERIVACLRADFAAEPVVTTGEPATATKRSEQEKSECKALYVAFEASHQGGKPSFDFRPVVLTPFYRKEVWQLYLADGVKGFRNKELAVAIGEVYANAELIEEQVEDIEGTYNDAFMKQVGRSAATDMEIAEIVHDEETRGGLSEHDLDLLVHVDKSIKEEHYASLEVQRVLELKVQRLKQTVLRLRSEVETVEEQIDGELSAMGEV